MKDIIRFKLGSLCCLLFLVSSMQAQVLIRPTAANSPFFKFDQLFKIQVVNTTAERVKGVVQVRVENNATKTLFQVNSLPVSLSKGQALNATQINWENGLHQLNQQLASTLGQTGQLPTGQYVYCYRFIDLENGRTIGSHCQESTRLNYQLPALIYPREAQVVNTPFPVLAWRPPLPIFGNELNYSLKLVELRKGQAPADAIYRNLPLLEKYRVKGLSMPYPVTAIPLKKGRSYAWQVTAFWRNTEVGKTEIWSFLMEDAQPIEADEPIESYRLVKNTMGGAYYVFSENIRFAYNNRNFEEVLSYSIYPKETPRKILKNMPIIPLIAGLNQVEISLDQSLELKKEIPYILKITDKKGREFFLGFKYLNKK